MEFDRIHIENDDGEDGSIIRFMLGDKTVGTRAAAARVDSADGLVLKGFIGRLTSDKEDGLEPVIPRVNIYLSHEDYSDPSLKQYLARVHANGIAPLNRAKHVVVFHLSEKLDPGEAMVYSDAIYGMGPKLIKKHWESVLTAISARRRADASKATPEVATLLARVSGKRP